jgi:predicted dehydrogenase
VLDASIHAVAYLRDLLGDVAELDARVLDRHPIVGGPDSLLMQTKMVSGAVGQFFACYTAKVHRETFLGLTVFGSQGSLHLTPGRLAWTTGGGASETLYRFDAADRGYRAQWRNFCRAVRGKEKIISTPENAYGDLMVIDAALRSARSGQRMILPNQPVAAAQV